MRFKFPGWGIGWFTPIFALGGPLLGYSAYINQGELYLFFTVFWPVIGLLALLTWFQQRWVAFPLIGFFMLALLGIAMSAVSSGVSTSLVVKLVCALGAMYELWEWRRSTAPTDATFGINDFTSDDLMLVDRNDRLI